MLNPHFDLPFRFSGSIPQATNLIPNGGFEINLNGWFYSGDFPGGNIVRSTAWSKYGAASLRLQIPSGTGTYGGIALDAGTRYPVTVGNRYTFSFMARGGLTTSQLVTRIVFYNNVGGLGPDAYDYIAQGPLTAGTERQIIHVSKVVPADSVFADVLIYVSDPPTDFSIDGVQVELGSIATPFVNTYGTVVTRTGNVCAAVAEQGSFEDIGNCVEAIIRTPLGFRMDTPDFGFPSLELLEQPILTKDVIEIVRAQEPRATVLISEKPDRIDVLIDRLTVEVN